MNLEPKGPPVVRDKLPRCPRKLFQTDMSATDALVHLETLPTQRRYLQDSTTSQSSSLTWFDQRAGRITSTKVYDILHTNSVSPAPSLLSSICSDRPTHFRSAPLDWGNANEPVAFREYTGWLDEDHESAVVSKAGLVIHPDHPHLAASPDGLVNCTCCGSGVLEIKCPYTFRGQTKVEFLEAKESCMDKGGGLLKSHRYFDQVQHQLFVTATTYCDFVVWLQPGHIIVDRIEVDPAYITATVPKLHLFWEKHVFRELQSHAIQNKQPKETSKSSHCSCGQPDNVDQMVGCDSLDCPIEWYHWSCVGITTKPRTKRWYCPSCKSHQAKKPRKA